MSFSKTKWGYSLKAVMKIKTNIFNGFYVALSLTQGGVTFNDGD